MSLFSFFGLSFSSQALMSPAFIPLVCSVSLVFFMNFLVSWLNLESFSCFLILFFGVSGFFTWIFGLRIETQYHTCKTNSNLQSRIKFFLVSEAFLFLSFFWRYYNFSWSQEYMSSRFPQVRRGLIDRFGVPMLNTALLLTSRFYATLALHSITIRDKFGFLSRMGMSVLLRVLFTFFQYLEYTECTFSIMSRTFRSIFFLATGFHRAHVFIRTSFLIVSLFRGYFRNFSSGSRIVGFLACIWYWHFVDVIWIFLYLLFYASYYPLFC